LAKALPDLSKFQGELVKLMDNKVKGASEHLTSQMKAIDSRLVNLRRDTNIEQFKQLLSKKADEQNVQGSFQEFEMKTS